MVRYRSGPVRERLRVLRHHDFRNLWLAAVPLGYAPIYVLGPTIAEETYDAPAVFGVVTASYGAGALAGALIGFRWRPRRPMLAAFAVIAVWPVMLVSFAPGAPVPVVLPLAFATGIGFALFDVFWNTTMAAARPLPRRRVGVDGLARPAAGRLSAGRPGGRADGGDHAPDGSGREAGGEDRHPPDAVHRASGEWRRQRPAGEHDRRPEPEQAVDAEHPHQRDRGHGGLQLEHARVRREGG